MNYNPSTQDEQTSVIPQVFHYSNINLDLILALHKRNYKMFVHIFAFPAFFNARFCNTHIFYFLTYYLLFYLRSFTITTITSRVFNGDDCSFRDVIETLLSS